MISLFPSDDWYLSVDVQRYVKATGALTMHNRTVGLDRPPHDAVAILEVDDDDLWLRILVDLLPHANEVVGL